MGASEISETPEDYGCNAISMSTNSVALSHGEENAGDIQLQELQAAADSCPEYQHIIEGYRKYKDRNDMRNRTRGTNDIVRSYGEIWNDISLEQGLLVRKPHLLWRNYFNSRYFPLNVIR